MAQYSEEWFYPNGQLAANQRAAVFGPGDNNVLASIFSDPGLTTPLPNPTVTDASGMLEFYAADGTYWIWVGPTTGGNGIEITLGASPGNPVLSVNGVAPDGSGNVELTAADVDAQPITTINALGDLYVGTGDNATTRLPIGSAGEVLTVVGGTASWEPGGGGAVDSVNGQTGVVVLDSADVGAQPIATIDAAGDLYVGTGPDATTRLPIGSAGEVLTVVAGTASWEPAPSAPVTSVNGETGAVVLDAADVGAVPTSRTITTQNGLTGGGDLTANRTIEPVYGTTSNTVAEGDDSRITGAQQRSTLTTLGDIYVATGPGTVTRLGVGMDSQVLISDSGEPTGLNWDTLDATDVGAVPTSRQIITQNGLTGGGDLTVDRTIEPVYGTTANTVAEGDDSRITGAIQSTIFDAKGDLLAASAADTPVRVPVGTDGMVLISDSGEPTGLNWDQLDATDVGAIANSIIDAKGDLIVGLAPDTPARLAVGTNGQVLTANSGATNGVEWTTPSSGGGLFASIKPRSGEYAEIGAVDVVRSSKAVTLNVMYLRPFSLTDAATLSAVAFELTSSTATALVRLGIYSSDAALQPDARVVDFGTFTADTSGLRAITGLSQALSANTLYWLAICFQTAAPNLRHSAGYNPWVSSTAFPTGTGAGWNSSYAETGVSGALPANTGTLVATDAPAVGAQF